ncbi:DUF3137 domain-containing protein [Amycolatopsis sp. FU40]|uniref:DUF3137 domain-containing protein n=1 Tax=Amycolatopsis sp. FU40 TaxID=2914159 RepID=UPI001F15C1B8|nr:DUF3137 domain-containing protein [Amycolatopsis sp. FU40]UKD53917.1 DUF3137 domain-containing protein [Amycolatopsis sp. FU40]
MDELIVPGYFFSGYALSFVLLWIAAWAERRSSVLAAVFHLLCGTTVSLTTLYWFSASVSVPALAWYGVPLVVAALLVWRGWHQQHWASRVDSNGEPSFGFLARHGLAVPRDHPDPWPSRATVEFTHHGHRLLGIEYSTESPYRDENFRRKSKLAEALSSIYSVVELRIPNVPALTIAPKTKAFAPDHFTPLEDMRITRNQFGWLRPDTTLHEFETDPGFDRRFSVYTSDPEFAREMLTGEVRELLLNDRFFRVHQVAFREDAIWTTDTGGLTEDRMFDNSRKLAMLAAAVPSAIWEKWANDRQFRSVATSADTGYDAWIGKRGGFIRTPLNRRRDARDRQPVTSISLTARTLIALAMITIGVAPAGNSLAVLTRLAPQVQATVSRVSEGGTRHCVTTSGGMSCTEDRAEIDGTYEQDGSIHEITADWTKNELPAPGTVVEVAVGPFWGHPGYQIGSVFAAVDLLGALIWLFPGLLLLKRTYLPSVPRRVKKRREALAEV